MKQWLIPLLFLLQLYLPNFAFADNNIPQKPQGNNIYVQDYAHILSAKTIHSINDTSRQLYEKTQSQIVVVTVPSLNGVPLENYSLELFRSWGIGSAKSNNGVLILVAVNDRQSRIEVGYGLEGALPDGKTGRLQDEFMIPYFASGDYDTGILQGYLKLAELVASEYNITLSLSADLAPHPAPNEDNSIWQKALFAAALIILLMLDRVFLGGTLFNLLLLIFLRGGGGGGRGGGGGGFGGGSSGGGGSSRKW
ncbi:MAG TPA: TPM domain-containing protein [Candidatus Avacidaminococcus intestinavium]|uniref:TPM domain-containing protein n=1 Tax=Candidatus Avacidaminococcus intestinavium TaxID=2840684 RepID=A0A9D1MQU0_9FIRM|nr:TPM domain-containing protein [Candidatus Avacidaminococcus intestinavium]